MDFWATLADLQPGVWQVTLAPSSEQLLLSRKLNLKGGLLCRAQEGPTGSQCLGKPGDRGGSLVPLSPLHMSPFSLGSSMGLSQFSSQ